MKAHAGEPGISEELGFERTRLAQDRTMLAWVRTATSLITFGFSIYNFLGKQNDGGRRWIGPSGIAIVMISIGLVALLLATLQHRTDRRQLQYLVPGIPYSSAAALAGLIAILGFFALISVVLRA